MMRLFKITLVTFLIFLVSILLLSCTSELGSAAIPEDQVAYVQQGNLTVDVTAVGNLALSRTEDLAFDLFYQEGTVEEILVEEGDAVEMGQVLARLDISEWDDELNVLEDEVIAAERQLTTKQRDLLQAVINLKNAEIALAQTDTTYFISDFKTAEAEVGAAEANLENTMRKLSEYAVGSPGYEYYQKILIQAQARLDTAEAKLEAMLSGFDTEEIAIKKLQLEIAEGKLEDAQIAITDAEEALLDAQKELYEAQSGSPVITAPFDGFITSVNVDGGDEVNKGTVAVQLADPTKFEADLMISELDILQVEVGGEAWVQVDAMPGINLPAKVAHISPTATIQSGVVNYAVKVEILSFESVMQERQETKQGMTQGELPERLRQAIEEGRITQEQAEEIIKRGQQGQDGRPRGQHEQIPGAIPEDFQLREGLTVTVSIIVDEAINVLLIPNSAIASQNRQIYVQVISSANTTEQRAIQVGITNGQFTEVIEGLSEGERVIVPQGTTAAIPATQQSGRSRGIVPGMGRLLH